MRALVTGATSGIGYEMARVLDEMGMDVIITGRKEAGLRELAGRLQNATKIITADLSDRKECMRLFEEAGEVDIVINNAGMGVHGAFADTSLEAELQCIDVNITALHILTKLYYQYFREKGTGYLMNVASGAAFWPGPYFAGYYASKAYVLRLTQALWKEVKEDGLSVGVSVFCPGSVDTEFNGKAQVKVPLKGISAREAAECAVAGMLKRKRIITTGFGNAFACRIAGFLPERLKLAISAGIQRQKAGKN